MNDTTSGLLPCVLVAAQDCDITLLTKAARPWADSDTTSGFLPYTLDAAQERGLAQLAKAAHPWAVVTWL